MFENVIRTQKKLQGPTPRQLYDLALWVLKTSSSTYATVATLYEAEADVHFEHILDHIEDFARYWECSSIAKQYQSESIYLGGQVESVKRMSLNEFMKYQELYGDWLNNLYVEAIAQ